MKYARSLPRRRGRVGGKINCPERDLGRGETVRPSPGVGKRKRTQREKRGEREILLPTEKCRTVKGRGGTDGKSKEEAGGGSRRGNKIGSIHHEKSEGPPSGDQQEEKNV